MSKCKWCGKETKLCRAHLIPDGLKKFLLGDVAGTQKFVRVEMKSAKVQSPVQTLEYDRNILCAECDGKLGVYDQALIEFFQLYMAKWQTEKLIEPKPIRLVVKEPYMVSLGFLAILYRFSLSSRHPKISIGGKFKSRFESWFLSGQIPSGDSELAKIMVFGTSEGEPLINWGMLYYIKRIREQGVNVYRLQLFGLRIFIRISNKQCEIENHYPFPSLGSEERSVTFALYPPHLTAGSDDIYKHFFKGKGKS